MREPIFCKLKDECDEANFINHEQQELVPKNLYEIEECIEDIEINKRVYKTYTSDFKVNFIKTYLQHGLSAACLLKGVDTSTASKWVRKYKTGGYDNLLDRRLFNGATPHDALEKFVYAKFVERRTKGLPVNISVLQNIALTAPFQIPNFKASIGWTQGFMRRFNIIRRKKTHATTTLIEEITKEILEFYDELAEVKSWNDRSIVYLNLDEIPVFFDMSSDFTLNNKGAQEVKILTHSKSKSRITLMSCVSHLGDTLPSLFVSIYKYAEKSDREFPLKYEHLKYQTDPYTLRFSGSGFSNEDFLSEYILKVIKPWKDQRNLNPVLIMDEAKFHMTPKVQNALVDAKVLPIYIPGGATSILQPLDVCLNKNIKQEIRKSYMSWLEAQVRNHSNAIEPPTLEEVIDWSQVSISKLTQEEIKNSFKVTGIVGDLPELRARKLLHSKLGTMVEDFLDKFGGPRELLEDPDKYYIDAAEVKLSSIALDHELELIE